MTITVTPQELGAFLDTVASAPVALRDVPRINSILARLVGLANSTTNIGALKAPEQYNDIDALLRGSPCGSIPADSPPGAGGVGV